MRRYVVADTPPTSAATEYERGLKDGAERVLSMLDHMVVQLTIVPVANREEDKARKAVLPLFAQMAARVREAVDA